MSRRKIHPLDAAEIALKEAARDWSSGESKSFSSPDTGAGHRDASWIVLKQAAKKYGKAWNTYVLLSSMGNGAKKS